MPARLQRIRSLFSSWPKRTGWSAEPGSRGLGRNMHADGSPGGRRVIASPSQLAHFLGLDMRMRDKEIFRVIFLDGYNSIVSDQVMWTGTIDSVQAHPREIVKQAIMIGTTAVILAHNHVTAPALPTSSDIALTLKIVRACVAIEIAVHDHMIIGEEGAFSMRAAGLIERMEKQSEVLN